MDSTVYRDRDLLKIGAAWLDDGQPFASATVISIWGSAPREVFSVIGETLVEVGSQCLCGIVASIRTETALYRFI